MLNARSDWIDWYNSIEDLAKRNEVWKYCDPLGIENLVFISTKPSDSASKHTIQKFQGLQSIFDSEKKKYDKVSDRIDYTTALSQTRKIKGKISALSLKSSGKGPVIQAWTSGVADGLLSSTVPNGTRSRTSASRRYAKRSSKRVETPNQPN
ncbi:hypothetical protein E8E12_000830 [Didymella heteroderae]|uniref:Uncharacterized protein n=1 Tax=Didymella heteroderae TaxID=1769908 RepID=A0A9P5BU90_9PLEO|nr:hypothetical protein E8E12_000830 [Didymella heteroderae]